MTIAELLSEIDTLRSTEYPFPKGKITFKDWIRLTDKDWVSVEIIDKKTGHTDIFCKQGYLIKKEIIRRLIKKEIIHHLKYGPGNYSFSYRGHYKEYVGYKVPRTIKITMY